MRKLIGLFVFLMFLGIQMSFAQAHDVTGTVTDKSDGSPLPGVAVMVKGTQSGTATDVNGKYTLNNVNPNAVLVFSFIGMNTVEVTVGNKNVINVALESASIGMDEVIVTGYGVTKKGSFTGAATVVDGSGIVKKTDANPIKALEGTVAGLQMNISSGQPGAPATIFIRGRNSYNSGTQPLYVIDGVPIESGTMGMRKSESQSISPLATLNPADIETMTVLKDATATSIYGARAANGVIVITTKQGKQGKVKVNVSAKLGVSMLPAFTDRYKLLNQNQYVELMSESLINRWPNDYTQETAIADLYGYFYLKPGEGANVDWFDEVTRNGLVQDYNLDITVGGEKETSAKYYLSFNYYKEDGIIIGKDLERYSGRFNLEQAPSKIVKYGFNSSFSYTDMNMGAGGGYFSDPITLAYGKMNPLIAVRNDRGEWNFNEEVPYNPVAQRSKYGDKSNGKQYRAIVSPYVTINFTPSLFFTSRGGMDLYSLKEFGVWSFLQPQGKDMRGLGEQGTTTRTLLSITNTLNWLKSYDEHHINLMIGQEAQHTRDNSSYLSGSNYPVMYLNQVELASVPGDAQTSLDNMALNSFFFNGQYDYANKYYLSASVRADGSSRFSSDKRWGVFYSIGGRYRISAEKFMQGTEKWLSNLTVRASYGTSGNQEVGGSWYASRDLFGFGYNYNNVPGSAHYQRGNKDLKWEQTGKFNVGADLGFFDNRLNVEFDYYLHRTNDMVFNVPISRTTGLSSIPTNVGKLENKGFEFSVNAGLIRTDKVRWDLTLVGGVNKNRIKKLSTNLPIEGSITIVEPGKDIYTFKMKKWAGVDPETGGPTWWVYKRDANGKVISKEKTTRYNNATKEYVGQASPKFQGSVSSNLNMYGFDFSFQLNYSLGGKIFGDNIRYDEQTGAGGFQNTTQYVYKNRWQKPGDHAKVPKFVYGNSSQANSASTRFLMKGDFLKIKNMTLGYTLPKDVVSKMRLGSIRVYMSMDNIYTFTASDYRGFDPSGIDANGFQWWNYPSPRNVMFGLNIGF